MNGIISVQPFNVVILIADNFIDNYVHRKLLENISFAKKYMEFSNPVEAINYLQIVQGLHDKSGNNSVDLIILDENISKMDTWEFIENYSSICADEDCYSKIIVLTDTTTKEMEQFNSEKSVIGCIQKPLNHTKMINCLKSSGLFPISQTC